MRRKLFAVALFALACSATLYASSVEAAEEAPAPRPVAGEDAKPGAKGKFGGFGGGKLDPEKLKQLQEKFGKNFDPAKFKDFKGKFDPEKLKEFKGKIDPEKLKDLKGKIDPEKLKDLKGKFGKGFGKKEE
ncbi:MAG: hypothetical protein FJ304_24250 [Planctomycetes bacterium]|nr:hypothetical protein [Planctomycetota bacterium]